VHAQHPELLDRLAAAPVQPVRAAQARGGVDRGRGVGVAGPGCPLLPSVPPLPSVLAVPPLQPSLLSSRSALPPQPPFSLLSPPCSLSLPDSHSRMQSALPRHALVYVSVCLSLCVSACVSRQEAGQEWENAAGGNDASCAMPKALCAMQRRWREGDWLLSRCLKARRMVCHPPASPSLPGETMGTPSRGGIACMCPPGVLPIRGLELSG